MIGNVLRSLLARRNVFAIAFAIDDLGQVPLRVDLDFEIVSRFLGRDH